MEHILIEYDIGPDSTNPPWDFVVISNDRFNRMKFTWRNQAGALRGFAGDFHIPSALKLHAEFKEDERNATTHNMRSLTVYVRYRVEEGADGREKLLVDNAKKELIIPIRAPSDRRWHMSALETVVKTHTGRLPP